MSRIVRVGTRRSLSAGAPPVDPSVDPEVAEIVRLALEPLPPLEPDERGVHPASFASDFDDAA